MPPFNLSGLFLGLIYCSMQLCVHGADDSYSLSQGGTLVANGIAGNPAGVLANDPPAATVATLQTPPSIGTLSNFAADGTFTYVASPNAYGSVTFTYSENSTTIVGAPIAAADTTSTWKYLNPLTGVDPHTATNNFNTLWMKPSFDDSAWGPCSGLMGYGLISGTSGTLTVNTDIGTPNINMRRTAYFRHEFSSPATVAGSLHIKILREDAAIIYLNGVELGRAYEPGAQAGFATQPDTWSLMVPGIATAWTSEGDEEITVHDLTFPGAQVFAGTNVLAVSVHNNLNSISPTSSDLALKVELAEIIGNVVIVPQTVTINIPDGHIPPVAQPDTYTIPYGQTLDTSASGKPSVYANDNLSGSSGIYDPLLGGATLDGPASNRNGFNFNSATGHFTYVPPRGFVGTDTFTYAVTDKDGTSTPVTVQIQVTATPFTLTWTHAEPKGTTVYTTQLGSTSLLPNQALTASVALKKGQYLSLSSPNPPNSIAASIQIANPQGTIVASACLCGSSHITATPATEDGVYQIQFVEMDGIGTQFQLDGAINARAITQQESLFDNLGSAFLLSESGKYEPLSILFRSPTTFGTPAKQGCVVDLPASAETLQVGWDAEPGSASLAEIKLENLTSGLNTTFSPSSQFRSTILNQTSLGNLNGAKIRLTLTSVSTSAFRGVAMLNVNHTVEAEPTPASELVQASPTKIRSGFLGNGSTAISGNRFAVFGDYGANTSNELSVANMVKAWSTEFIVTLGDNNYLGAGTLSTWETAVGNFYGDYILARADGLFPKQTSTTQKFFPVPGNHDYYNGSSTGTAAAVVGGNCANFIDYFITNSTGGAPRLPISTGRADSTGIYYDFVKNNCHFFMIDSNQTLTNSAFLTETQNWLTARIAQSTASWKILVCHHSSYGSSTSYGTTSQMTWVASVPGIDVVLQAHAHIYERIAINNKLILNVGTGGTSLYALGTALPEDKFRTASYGAVMGTASDSGLKFEFYTPTGGTTPLDSITLGTFVVNDRDVYAFAPGQWTTTRFTMRAKSYPLNLANALRPKLEILSANGTVLASGVAPAAGGTAILDWLETSGNPNLSVRVSGVGTGQGEYVLEETSLTANNYQTWTGLHFATANEPGALPDADPDKDGVTNFLEYALGTLPNTFDTSSAALHMPIPVRPQAGGEGVDLTTLTALPQDAHWTIQYTPDLAIPWISVATRAPSQTWLAIPSSENHVVTQVASDAISTTHRFQRQNSGQARARGFYRLLVNRIP